MSKLTEEERVMWDTLVYSYDRGEKIRRNPDILRHVVISQKMGRVTEPLAYCIIHICERYAGKPQWHGFTYRGDMISHAVLFCLKGIMNFNPKKSSNPFAYITQCCNGAFHNYMAKEKRQYNIKEQMLEEQKIIAEENKCMKPDIK